jgi:hypothetical protein
MRKNNSPIPPPNNKDTRIMDYNDLRKEKLSYKEN